MTQFDHHRPRDTHRRSYEFFNNLLVAVMRKLLTILNSILRHDKPWTVELEVTP